MKKGILVNNQFAQEEKMRPIDRFLTDAAERNGVELRVLRSGELRHCLEDLKGLEADFALFWDKDVVLARMLENSGIRVYNPADGIMNCDNKAYTYIALASKGVRTPRTIVAPFTYEGVSYTDDSFIEDAMSRLSYPVIVKELYGSYGEQVYCAASREEITSLMRRFGSKGFLLQEFIRSSYGRDIRVNVVGGEVVSSMMRYNEHGDFRSNISLGGSMKKHDCTEEERDLAISACRALSLDFAGVDLLFGTDGPYVCEVNSNPHFKSSVECTGVDMSDYIIRHILHTL